MDAIGLELETFIGGNDVDELTAQWLRVQSKAVINHFLNTDPPKPGPGLKRSIVSQIQNAAQEVSDSITDVSKFIVHSEIDDNAMELLVMQSEDIQQAVVLWGPLTGIKNPSAEIVSRISKTKQAASPAEPVAAAASVRWERDERGVYKRGGVKQRERKEANAAAVHAQATFGAPAIGFGVGSFVPPPPPTTPPPWGQPPPPATPPTWGQPPPPTTPAPWGQPPPPPTPPPLGHTSLRPAAAKGMSGGVHTEFPYMLNSALQEFRACAMQLDQGEDVLRSVFERVLDVRRVGGAVAGGGKRPPGVAPERQRKGPRLADGSPEAQARRKEILDAIVKVVSEAGGGLNIERIGGAPSVKNLRRGFPEADSLAAFIRANPGELCVEEGEPRADGNRVLHVKLSASCLGNSS